MSDYRTTLRRVGLVLIVGGLIDIAWMVHVISQNRSYSSSFNIFAVIAGIYLIRGHLGAARLVTMFSAFYLAGFVLFVPAFMTAFPFDYLLHVLRSDPAGNVGMVLVMAAVLGTLGWVYHQLRSSEVVAARAAAGQKSGPPIGAFAIGAALAIGLGTMAHVGMRGEKGQKAMHMAAGQDGAKYKYAVTSMRMSNAHVWATVTAYNDTDTKDVSVEWEE